MVIISPLTNLRLSQNYALTDKAGNYTIEGVPPGKYVVKTWHEKLKEVSQDVTVEAGKAATANFDLKRRR
ncbi:MAG: carboxypeptidase regulatory-like domain-containing protein [Planctomycetes bacterium]|nr:carboxypeptidase regulatory-like domain-containing protein [Planctomycetota bacterium]